MSLKSCYKDARIPFTTMRGICLKKQADYADKLQI